MTAGVLGGCGNSTENNAKTDTNAQNNANTAEIKENANADVTEIANADGTVYKVGIRSRLYSPQYQIRSAQDLSQI